MTETERHNRNRVGRNYRRMLMISKGQRCESSYHVEERKRWDARGWDYNAHLAHLKSYGDLADCSYCTL